MSFNNLHFVLAEVEPVVNEHSVDLLKTILHSNVANFIIVVIFIAWVIRKTNFIGLIRDRQKAISSNISKAENDCNNADNLLNETKTLVSNTKNEVDKIVGEAKQVADSLTTKIKEEIVTETQELHNKAEKTIISDASKVKSEVSKDITKAAFVVAEQHIKNAVDDRLHRKYIDEFIDSLSNLKV